MLLFRSFSFISHSLILFRARTYLFYTESNLKTIFIRGFGPRDSVLWVIIREVNLLCPGIIRIH